MPQNPLGEGIPNRNAETKANLILHNTKKNSKSVRYNLCLNNSKNFLLFTGPLVKWVRQESKTLETVTFRRNYWKMQGENVSLLIRMFPFSSLFDAKTAYLYQQSNGQTSKFFEKNPNFKSLVNQVDVLYNTAYQFLEF